VDKIRGLEDEAREIRESRGHQKIETREPTDQSFRRQRTPFGLVLIRKPEKMSPMV
jgi:hypothetical protein